MSNTQQVTLDANTLKQEIRDNMRVNLNTMIWGGPGIGKSEIPQQVADDLGVKLLDFRANLFDPVDVRGIPHIVSNPVHGDQTSWAAPDIFPTVERDGERGIFMIDELPTAPPATQNAFLQLLLTRQVGNYTMPDGWSVVSAGNRLTDGAAVYQMPKPVCNRLMHYDLEPNLDVWCDWALKNEIHTTLVSFMRYRPNLLYSFKADEYAFPTPRSWSFVDKRLGLTDDIHADRMFYGIAAAVGDGPAGEFLAFAKVANKLPDIDNLIKNPTTYMPTDDPAVLYALTGAVSARAQDDKMENIMKLTSKLPVEFQVVLVKGILAIDRNFIQHTTINAWIQKNSNVVL
jgi:hypothetical protein|tara:strand:+ start:1868 stop:2899 length:1032 start_codon:yes stop_codon:yes gene_type:complete